MYTADVSLSAMRRMLGKLQELFSDSYKHYKHYNICRILYIYKYTRLTSLSAMGQMPATRI